MCRSGRPVKDGGPQGSYTFPVLCIVGAMVMLIAAIVSACILAAVFYGLSVLASSRARLSAGQGTIRTGQRSCPLCSSVLSLGERVKSSIFPGKGDRIMHIFGCPNCWPGTPSVPRICPVCGQALDAKGFVIARYFERPGLPGRGPGLPGRGPGRRHVHVLGCTGCRG